MDLTAGLFASPIGFLHFVQADQENLELAVWTTATRPLCTAPHEIHYPISQAGIWVDAFHQRRVVIHNDYAAETHRKGVPEGHFPLVREMVAPVLEDDAVRMIIGVGNRARPYTQEDAQLFEVVAADLWRMIQRNRAELQLQEANRNLESQVSHRTQRLVNLNEELEAFSYSVSHDLRAPLRAVTGFAEALAESAQDTLTKEQQDYLQRIQKAGHHMGTLIEDLLTLSRLGRRELQPGPFDLGDCARDIIEQLRAQEPQRQVELRLGPGLQAQGDPGLLRIALENLLGNAWKFTGPREQALIELTAGASEGGVPTFVLRDNGVGFPAHKADRLFTAFQRLHASADFPGTGIGLAMVRRIITRHGGTLWAEGREGSGAAFYFTLPGPEAAP
jgi:signal transduction histidine kinase